MNGSTSETTACPLSEVIYGLYTGMDGRKGLVQFGSFRLKIHGTYPEAPESPFYINLRVPENKGTLTEGQVYHIAVLMAERVWLMYPDPAERPDFLCGLPKAGEPFVEVMSRITRIPVLKLHKRGEGDIRRIVATSDICPGNGQKVLVVDDLITNAKSKLEGVDALRSADYVVNEVLVFLKRGGEECENELARHSLRLTSVTTLEKMLSTLQELDCITRGLRDECLAYQDELDAYVKVRS